MLDKWSYTCHCHTHRYWSIWKVGILTTEVNQDTTFIIGKNNIYK